jgi:hypothetical protein
VNHALLNQHRIASARRLVQVLSLPTGELKAQTRAKNRF